MADEYLGHPRLARQAAKDAGEIHYRTGKPCTRGHISERLTSTGQCIECRPIVKRQWRKANRQTYLAGLKRKRDRHPDKVKAARLRHRTRHADRLKKAERERARRRLNTEEYELSKAKQKLRKETLLAEAAGRPRPNVCDICGEGGGKIVFDHCHVHGHFRGWLCNRCNWVLGHAKDDPSLLRKMAEYLEANVGQVEGGDAQQASGLVFCGAGSFLSGGG